MILQFDRNHKPSGLKIPSIILKANNSSSISTPYTEVTSAFTSASNSPGFFSTCTTPVTSIDQDDVLSCAGAAALDRRDKDLKAGEIAAQSFEKKLDALDQQENRKLSTSDPYALWQCPFNSENNTISAQIDVGINLSVKSDFLSCLKKEITATKSLQSAMSAFLRSISTGEHHKFTDDFLKTQTRAVHESIGQIFHIAEDLAKMVTEAETTIGEHIAPELIEAFLYVQPHIIRTSATLIANHVFFKINYVLASDKKMAEAMKQMENVKT